MEKPLPTSRIKHQDNDDIYDVIIIGAGPCGLATAARLRERTPAAIFTDEEHRRYHWIGKHGNKMSLKSSRSGKTSAGHSSLAPEYKMLVIDATDDKWLSRWNRLFSTYDISHLRSPMLWHVDPLDRDSLLSHAYTQQRENEMVEIKNCVGKERSKHARKKMAASRACGGKFVNDGSPVKGRVKLTILRQSSRVDINLRERNDYYTPSRSLFFHHCEQVATRYDLDSKLIKHENVENIDYDVVKGVSIDDKKLFTVTTHNMQRYAITVILAVGPANVPKIPHLPSMTMAHSRPRQVCHGMEIQEFPDICVQRKVKAGQPTNILVVGGGLTSAQLSDLAIRRGVTKVWHMMRGPCRVKHFDVDLEWMGKYKNAEQARFWSANSDAERLDMIKSARGGGSVTPLFHKRLKKHIASGKLALHTETSLLDATFNEANGGGSWTIQTNPPIEGIPAMDYIYFATGVQTDYSSLPYLQSMVEKYPIHGHGGFPCLTEDLMWKDGVPLFVVGKLAALQLGPAGPNIGGAKLGAERVAWAIEDLIQLPGSRDANASCEKGRLAEYLSGQGNMYSTLTCS